MCVCVCVCVRECVSVTVCEYISERGEFDDVCKKLG